MSPSRLHVVFGIILFISGLVFDFGFVTTTESFRSMLGPQTPPELWRRYAYELTRFYLFALGLTSVALGLVGSAMAVPRRSQWAILALIGGGSVLFLGGGLWEAQIGPVYRNEPACYVLGTGLFAIVVALVLEGYVLLSTSR